jgi:oligopeptide/dipeptide ABC transporter ATP-binding protein
MNPVLKVESLSKHFNVKRQDKAFLPAWLGGKPPEPLRLHAVDDVSLTLQAGQSLGIVGESGCGKSTLVRLITRLIDPDAGHVLFRNVHIGDIPAATFAKMPERALIQQVFQDPTDSLNPRFTAFECIADPLRRLGGIRDAATLKKRVEDIAERVALPAPLLGRYPHQLSGGQKLRVGIGRGIALNPPLLILDEPTSALDVSVQATILQLLDTLRRDLGLSYLFVSHDLNVVRMMCDSVMVMYLGKVVEYGDVDAVFDAPAHPYTQALLSAIPTFGESQRAVIRLSEEPQSPINPSPHCCRFYSRCQYRQERCQVVMPHLSEDSRQVACHFPLAAAVGSL